MPKPPRSMKSKSKKSPRRSDTMDGRLRVPFTSLAVSPLALPDRFRTKLVYSENYQITNAAAWNDRVWNINSVFDPDQTGVGHQPRYYDQLAALYNRYRVLSCTIDLSVRQRTTHGISVLVIPNNSVTALTPSTVPAELRRSGVCKITSANQPPVVYRTKFEPWAITGVSKMQYMTDDRFQAAVGANPTEAICAHQYIEAIDGSTAVDYEFIAQLVYEVEFFDAIDPSLSSLRPRQARPEPAAAAAPAPRVCTWDPRSRQYVPSDDGEDNYELVPTRSSTAASGSR